MFDKGYNEAYGTLREVELQLRSEFGAWSPFTTLLEAKQRSVDKILTLTKDILRVNLHTVDQHSIHWITLVSNNEV